MNISQLMKEIARLELPYDAEIVPLSNNDGGNITLVYDKDCNILYITNDLNSCYDKITENGTIIKTIIFNEAVSPTKEGMTCYGLHGNME